MRLSNHLSWPVVSILVACGSAAMPASDGGTDAGNGSNDGATADAGGDTVTFVNTHGGGATLYKDPTGKHGGLPKNTTARDTVLSFIAN